MCPQDLITSPDNFAMMQLAYDNCIADPDSLELCVSTQLEALNEFSLGCVQNCLTPYAICIASKCPQCSEDGLSDSCFDCANVGFTFASAVSSGTGPGYLCMSSLQQCAFGTACFNPLQFKDGKCDPLNNNNQCDYDGGDCCEDTCNDSVHTCGSGETGFFCADPEQQPGSGLCSSQPQDIELLLQGTFLKASSEAAVTCSDDVNCIAQQIGDGISGVCLDSCLVPFTSCLFATCPACATPQADGSISVDCNVCAGFDLNPAGANSPAPGLTCVNTLYECAFSVQCDNPFFFKDGKCDPANNMQACNYDGGDCCGSTCVSQEENECGVQGFDCMDPLAGKLLSYRPGS